MPGAPTRWQVFAAAPHRMFFASGMAGLLAWSGWWALLLAARSAGLAGLEPARPALLLHGGMMLYLLLPPFMYGFLLTVFPRWMSGPDPHRGFMYTALGCLNLGNLLFLAGLAGFSAGLAAGWLLAALAMALVATQLFLILARAGGRVSHAFAVLAGLASGLIGMGLFVPTLTSGDFGSWPLVRGLGLWAFLLVVYFGVCHRMIPFFSSRVVPGYVTWRPDGVLYLFVVLAIARGCLEVAPSWAWLASLPLAMLGGLCAWRWRPRQSSGVPLLNVLHVSMAWLVAGLALAAVADLAAALGAPGLIGRAPLHALGMGFFGGMLMAMVTRVTMGHSGRPLALDSLNHRLFIVVQVAAGARVAAEFLPGASAALSLVAAAIWLAAFGTWAARLLPIYLRPRIDGAPG